MDALAFARRTRRRRIVDEDVEPAERGDRSRHHRSSLVRLTDIAWRGDHRKTIGAEPRDLTRRFRVRSPVIHGDARA